MIWQDAAILLGQLVLFLTLIPTINSGVRVPLLTSVPASLVLFGFAATFMTLALWGSAMTSILNGLAWAAIVFNAMDDNYVVQREREKAHNTVIRGEK